jgi:signal peptidase I
MSPSSETPVSWIQRVLVGRNLRRTLIRATIVAVVAVVVFKFILLPMRIDGQSMAPTYRSGGFNFVNRLAYLRHGPLRGDVVAIRMAGLSVMYLKRVVGLPSERVAIRQGVVQINGQPLDEPYVKQPGDWTVREFQLADGEYFVVGDNRAMRQQRHVFGVASRDRIAGKALF